MSRGKSRLFRNSRGHRTAPSEDLVDTFIVKVDDLEFDTLNIESRQQRVYRKERDDTEKVTFFKPKANLVLGGRTITLRDDDFLDFIMNVTGALGYTSDMNSKQIQTRRKNIHITIINDFQSDDWESVLEKYKKRMHSRNINLLRIQVDNTQYIPSIYSAIPLKTEVISSEKIIGWLKEVGADAVERVDNEDVIITEERSDDFVIKSGFRLFDSGGNVIVSPFMTINNERFNFGETAVHPTTLWEEDVSDALMKDVGFIEKLAGSAVINSRRPLKGADEKFFTRVTKSLKHKFGSARNDLPKDVFDGVVDSFEKNLKLYCNSKEFGASNVCVDLALNKSLRSYSFPSRMNKKVREIVLDFSGDVK